MAKKVLKWLGILVLIMISTYLLGPSVEYPNVNTEPISFDIPLETLDDYVASIENEITDIKPGNEAKIVWADTSKTKTEYSVVYLHGFSASREEGHPLHENFATFLSTLRIALFVILLKGSISNLMENLGTPKVSQAK